MKLFFTQPLFLLALLSLGPLVTFWRRRPTSLSPARSRFSLGLRCLTIACLCLALAGTKIVSSSDKLTVLFLLDRSLSTGGDSQAWQRTFIGNSLSEKETEDQFGVLLFGEDSGIEIPTGTHGQPEIGQFTTVVDRRASSLTSALRFAATAFPGETARRLVVMTDGQSTESGSEREIQALSAAGIEVWLVPLPEQKGTDVLLSRFESPAHINVKEPFLLRTVIESRGIDKCRLLISENGVPTQDLALTLREGSNLFLLPQRQENSGPVQYLARIVAEKDERPENNMGESLTLIGGEQRVLILRKEEGPGPLVPLLQRAGLKAQAVKPSELPQAVGAWRDVSALIIEDVDSLQWSKRLQTVTNLLVREGGMGLLMCGRDATFGVGAYQQTPIEPLLPVNLSIRRPKDQPLSALVQLLDKSGSMSGDPICMAREAAIASGDTLSERDLVGVVGFDSAARWVVPLQAKKDGDALRDGVSTLRAGGGTDLFPALQEALQELESARAPLKHIIVLSDGAVATGNYDQLLRRANESRVTVSAVAFGQGADIRFLEDLTQKGKGRLFRSEQTVGGSTLAQIFIRDTVLATGSGIQETPVDVRPTVSGQHSPLLQGLNFDGSPKLSAHNMASSKGGTAQTLLQSPKKDPILAVGRAGLGHTAAWLSDLGGDWSKSWNETPGLRDDLSLLETLLIRTIRSVVSSESLPLAARGNRLEVQASATGDLARLELTLSTRRPIEGPVRLVSISKDGASRETILQATGPFSASGTIDISEPGSGLILAQTVDGQLLARTNFTVPLAPEFTRLGTDKVAMKRWSQVPQGQFDPSPEAVFRAPAEPVPIRTPLEHDLARGALLLLLLEIAIRRLPLPKTTKSGSDQAKALTKQMETRFSRLREAKKSLKNKPVSRETPPALLKVERLKIEPAHKAGQTKDSTEQAESTLSRLKRTRKKL